MYAKTMKNRCVKLKLKEMLFNKKKKKVKKEEIWRRACFVDCLYTGKCK